VSKNYHPAIPFLGMSQKNWKQRLRYLDTDTNRIIHKSQITRCPQTDKWILCGISYNEIFDNKKKLRGWQSASSGRAPV
jgi:hypothetical protein